MGCNKFALAASMATFVVVAVILVTANAAPSDHDDSGSQQAPAASTRIKMSSLFDFNAYKRLFKKSYSGLLENMTRFKFFIARAICTSISAVKYRLRFKRYHLSINHLSDRSPDELDRMRNKVLEREYTSDGPDQSDNNNLPEFIPGDHENVVASLRRLIDDNAGKPEFEALRAQLEQVDTAHKRQQPQQSPSKRRKREVELAEEGPRELPLSELINVAPENPDAELPPETRAKIRARPKSDNPLYGGGPKVAARSLIDQQMPLSQKYFGKRTQSSNVSDEVSIALESLRQKYSPLADGARAKLPDQVFLDLRTKSNCFFAPRGQGECASCYAFASTTVAEYIHCQTTGELVPLSEQYMVDCGKAYQSDGAILGCAGGILKDVNKFYHNFGWELRDTYPYMAREQQCPYAPDTDLRTTGYIRADLRNAVEYDMSLWHEALVAIGPLAVQMNMGPEFGAYGSGIFDACKPKKPDHVAVVVGHGRKDGEEYWLIRNSHSVGWGEGGYMKLSKSADCIWPRTGWSFGTDDGFTWKVRPTRNELNDGEAIRKHYAKSVYGAS